MRKILNLIIIALLCIGCLTACNKKADYVLNEEPIEEIDYENGFISHNEDVYTLIDETERLILKANLSNGEVLVTDKESGKEWYSNPSDKEEDGLASGFNRVSLYSQVLVNYTTSESVAINLGSYTGAVTKGGLTSRVEDKKVIFKYTFEKEGIVIPVRYSLDNETFVAEILTKGVEEHTDNQVKSIELLPFFGAGTKQDEGYFLVPDGSGGLINFNNGKVSAKPYEMSIFGFDNGTNDKVISVSQARQTSLTLSENVYLPLFGEKCNDDGFLAIMTKGRERAQIKARTSGKYTNYNNIWTAYNYRATATVRLMQKEMTEQTTSISEKMPETSINYEVRYIFLKHGEAEYADMAKLYQKYLVDMEGMTVHVKEGDIPFYLDLYGYIRKTKSFLGIPKDTKIAATTIKDAKDIVKTLNNAGVKNIVLKYNYWMKNGYYDKIQTDAEVESIIGTAKEMNNLQQELLDTGGSLYLATELINIYKTGNGVSRLNNVLNSVANTPLMQYQFSLDTANTDTRYDPWYLVKILDLPEYMNIFINNFNKKGFKNVAIESIGTMLYSDLSSGGISRSKVPKVISDVLKMAEHGLDSIMISGANSYTAVYATHILDAPVKSSNYDIVDENIPLYQMVFHGYSYYSIGAANLSSNPDDLMLRCLEYGAAPMFSWTARNHEELVGSRTDFLFSPDYNKWIEYAYENYNELNEILKETTTLKITGHKNVSDNVSATTYGGIITIVVNYNDVVVTYEDNHISAKGYLVLHHDYID